MEYIQHFKDYQKEGGLTRQGGLGRGRLSWNIKAANFKFQSISKACISCKHNLRKVALNERHKIQKKKIDKKRNYFGFNLFNLFSLVHTEFAKTQQQQKEQKALKDEKVKAIYYFSKLILLMFLWNE